MPPEGSDTAAPARLAIVVPAFGRAEAIAASVAGMAEEARAQGLDTAFYVSDDTPDDSVERALAPLLGKTPAVYYRSNRPSLGHDRNIIASLLWPDADYVWPIGSNFRAASGALHAIVAFLHAQDLVFVNSHAERRPRVDGATGEAGRRLLRDMLWHQTLTGTTIYARSVRDWVAQSGDRLTIVRNFPQVCTILGFAAEHDPVIGWFDEQALQFVGGASESYWRKTAIDVFARDWGAAVSAFPSVVLPDEQTRVIRAHSARTGLFGTPTLISLKENRQFVWSSLTDDHVRRAMHLPLWKQVLILALPISLLRVARRGWAVVKPAIPGHR